VNVKLVGLSEAAGADPPQPGNLKFEMRVLQLKNRLFDVLLLYQKVQSSTGSTVMEL